MNHAPSWRLLIPKHPVTPPEKVWMDLERHTNQEVFGCLYNLSKKVTLYNHPQNGNTKLDGEVVASFGQHQP